MSAIAEPASEARARLCQNDNLPFGTAFLPCRKSFLIFQDLERTSTGTRRFWVTSQNSVL